MRNPKFNNKDGSLTAYAFACGYLQQWFEGETYVSSNCTVTLGMEHGVYYVKSFDERAIGQGKNEWNEEGGWRTWLHFETLKEARKEYRQRVREFKLQV